MSRAQIAPVLTVAGIAGLIISGCGESERPTGLGVANDALPTGRELDPYQAIDTAGRLINGGSAAQADRVLSELLAQVTPEGGIDANREGTTDRAFRAALLYNLGLARLNTPHPEADPRSVSRTVDENSSPTNDQRTPAELFRAADLAASDYGLRARARLNLGHALARAVLPPLAHEPPVSIASLVVAAVSTDDPSVIIDGLRLAAGAFRAAAEIGPADNSVRMNAADAVERTRLLIRAIEDELANLESERERQRQEFEQRTQEIDRLADQLDELADRQQQEAERNQDPSRANTQAPSTSGTAQDRQDDLAEETSEAAGQASELGSLPEALTKSLEQARAAQERASDRLAAGENTPASEDQLEAADRLRAAAGQLRDAAEQEVQETQGDGVGNESQEQPGEPDEQDESQKTPEPSTEEFAKMQRQQQAEELLEQERQLREARQAGRSFLPTQSPSERDW